MKKQAGITLLEVVVALGIMSVVVAGTAALIDRTGADTRAAVAAQQMKTVGDAASAYIKDNYAAVTANATATTPALIRVSDLVAGGYLTTGATVTNAYQQNQCVLVLEPTANNLTALAVSEAGTTIDDLSLGGVAALIGAAGGGIYSTATTTVRGAMGGWSLATGNFANANHLGQHCDGTAGVVTLAAGHPAVALWFANGSITSGFLYRAAVPGHPELNQMDTPLIMGSVQAVAGACVAGAIARDALGALLTCDVGTLLWKAAGGSQYWQDPAASFATLPACNAAAINQTRIVQTPTVGTGPRAYTCNGATWQPIAVDNSGNITIAGTATVGQAQINTVVVENTACGSNGLVARDATGLILSCQSGVWRPPSGKANRLVFTSSSNWTVPVGVTSVVVSLAGGGSSGATTAGGSSGGSSGGFLQNIPVSVAPGAVIPITVGPGGAGGANLSTGNAGGTSSFGASLQCTGGQAPSFSGVFPAMGGACTNVPGYGTGLGAIGAAVLTNSFSIGGPTTMINGYGSGGMVASWGNGAQQSSWNGSQGVVIVEY